MSKVTMPESSGWIMDGGVGGTLRYQRGPISQIQSLIHSNAPVWEERDMQKYVEAYASAKVREALEEAAEIADRNNDFSTYDAIRALIPPLPGPVEP